MIAPTQATASRRAERGRRPSVRNRAASLEPFELRSPERPEIDGSPGAVLRLARDSLERDTAAEDGRRQRGREAVISHDALARRHELWSNAGVRFDGAGLCL
jgi:hypothetical protein